MTERRSKVILFLNVHNLRINMLDEFATSIWRVDRPFNEKREIQLVEPF